MFVGGNAAAWLHTIALRLAFNELRRRWPTVSLLAGEPTWAMRSDPDLWQALADLDPRQRAALLLSVLDGYTHEEIGRMLGVRAGTVSSWPSRAGRHGPVRRRHATRRAKLHDHQALGWILHLAPLPILLAAFFARAGRRHWIWALVLAIVVFIVPVLVVMRDSQRFVAAFHPVLAALAFGLSLMVARNSIVALREPLPAPAPSRPA